MEKCTHAFALGLGQFGTLPLGNGLRLGATRLADVPIGLPVTTYGIPLCCTDAITGGLGQFGTLPLGNRLCLGAMRHTFVPICLPVATHGIPLCCTDAITLGRGLLARADVLDGGAVVLRGAGVGVGFPASTHGVVDGGADADVSRIYCWCWFSLRCWSW